MNISRGCICLFEIAVAGKALVFLSQPPTDRFNCFAAFATPSTALPQIQRDMTMAMVNIMSMSKPCLMTCHTPFPLYSCNYHIHTKKYTTSISPNINTISYYNNIFYSHQFSFSLSKSTTSFKSTLAQMQTQFSKSGISIKLFLLQLPSH